MRRRPLIIANVILAFVVVAIAITGAYRLGSRQQSADVALSPSTTMVPATIALAPTTTSTCLTNTQGLESEIAATARSLLGVTLTQSQSEEIASAWAAIQHPSSTASCISQELPDQAWLMEQLRNAYSRLLPTFVARTSGTRS